jgi:flagellar biosynthesis protein FlhF
LKVEQQIEYEAKSDAEAIQVARDRLGREAVILSSKPVKLGGLLGFFRRDALWVTAGILVPDQEDMLRESRDRMVAFQHLLEVRRAVGGANEHTASRPRVGEPLATSAFTVPAAHVQAASPAVVAAAYEANSTPKAPSDVPIAKDVDEIKEILAKVLSRLDGGGSSVNAPPDAPMDENMKRLIEADVDRDIAREIVNEYSESALNSPFAPWLSSKINTLGSNPSNAIGGRRILFAGPTGVGKTTTIAKIAASQSLWGDRKVVLMTADTYRIAAVEQLRTYAKILGIPIEITAEPKDVQNALRKHKDADLILLDTAGRSHYDGDRLDELHALYDAYDPDTVHLVLAANIKYRDMLNVIDRMGVVPLSALLFTKLDETSTYGSILNVMRDFDLPASFFTTGQNVPNDIEIARSDRLVDLLFKNAVVWNE